MDKSVISEDEKKLSYAEKLVLLDQEIRELHQCCVSKGFSPYEIEKSATPILQSVSSASRKKCLRAVVKVGIFLLFAYALFHYDPAYKFVCAWSRLGAMQLLPWWDWSAYYNSDCFIDNPYYEGIKLEEEDCEVCETMTKIARMDNMSHSVMSESYLKQYTPVIVTDAMENWKAMEKFNIKFLDELYSTEELLKEEEPCVYTSNVLRKFSNNRDLLRKAARGDLTSWYAHWENCHIGAAKILRRFYRRPYFIPPMVEMTETNYLFLSANYHSKHYKLIPVSSNMVWIGVVRGEMKFELTPKPPCRSVCGKLYATIKRGEILVTPDFMWELTYFPTDSSENIAIGAEGNYD